MANVTFDGPNKLIIVDTGVTTIDVQVDLYSDWKEWVLTSDNAKYPLAFTTTGGDALGGSEYLGAYFFLENDWKIRPYEGNHVLNVNGNLFTRDGSSPFVATVGAFNVSIRSKFSSLTNIITVAGGGGGGGTTDALTVGDFIALK